MDNHHNTCDRREMSCPVIRLLVCPQDQYPRMPSAYWQSAIICMPKRQKLSHNRFTQPAMQLNGRLNAIQLRQKHVPPSHLRQPCLIHGFSRTRGLQREQRTGYQLPVLAMEAQGSFGASESPRWSNSREIPSGERTKAIWPSRGGRLMVTPLSIRDWQRA